MFVVTLLGGGCGCCDLVFAGFSGLVLGIAVGV